MLMINIVIYSIGVTLYTARVKRKSFLYLMSFSAPFVRAR